MKQENITDTTKTTDVIRIELGDWLFNAGLLGLMRILSYKDQTISDKIKIEDSYIEFTRSAFKGFTDKFFEAAFQMHGKYNYINQWLNELSLDVKEAIDQNDYTKISKKYNVQNPTESNVKKAIINEITNRWVGVAYKSLKNIKKSKYKTLSDINYLIEELLSILKEEREFFLEKEVQTFLRNQILGESSFLNKSVTKDQKKHFFKDFEEPLINNQNKKDKNYHCIHCNSRKAKTNTIFNTGLVVYQGLNKDSLNFAWKFNPKLPLCEICELVYFSHWAGFTKSIKRKSYLFVNEDSNIKSLWEKNQLLKQVLTKDKRENILVNYFYELLVEEEKIKSKYALQNIALIETDLKNDVMPKVLSFNISRAQAEYIKNQQEKLTWIANKFYKIKNDYTNILHDFIKLMFSGKLNFKIVNRLIKYYLQSKDETKNYILTNCYPLNIQQIIVLISDYFKSVKQKQINMENKHIWRIYHLGNEMKNMLVQAQAENKITSYAYRLINAVRADDRSTFLNVLLRLYIGYNKEVPKDLTNTLESRDKFQIIGHSYINGLLGEQLKTKSE
jgi:CRISPR-associated protein Cst1